MKGYIINPDKEYAQKIIEGIYKKDGHCPCRVTQDETTLCPCDEFRRQLENPQYHGLCHCRLYRKP
jgi:ferredoxin-thioredoxin reductase catalytic subunit